MKGDEGAGGLLERLPVEEHVAGTLELGGRALPERDLLRDDPGPGRRAVPAKARLEPERVPARRTGPLEEGPPFG